MLEAQLKRIASSRQKDVSKLDGKGRVIKLYETTNFWGY